jgi:hypothetical protein
VCVPVVRCRHPWDRQTACQRRLCCAPQAQKHWAQLYRGVPRGALAWGGPVGRCARLLAEIGRHAPDVIALQEVDRFQDIWTALSAAGCAPEIQIESRVRWGLAFNATTSYCRLES